MQAYGKLDEQVFWEFVNDRDKLRRIGTSIREVLQDNATIIKLSHIPDEEEFEVKAGSFLHKLHKIRE